LVEVKSKVSFPDIVPLNLKNDLSESHSIPCTFKGLIFVRYLDHVIFNRTSALTMKPQVREAIGWLVYECEYFITITWDRDADPPTLKGGDPKASGLVLLKSDILNLQRLPINELPLQKNSECHLNLEKTTVKTEYALKTTGRKTLKKGETAT
jgi:hypothetical protein